MLLRVASVTPLEPFLPLLSALLFIAFALLSRRYTNAALAVLSGALILVTLFTLLAGLLILLWAVVSVPRTPNLGEAFYNAGAFYINLGALLVSPAVLGAVVIWTFHHRAYVLRTSRAAIITAWALSFYVVNLNTFQFLIDRTNAD